MLDLMRAQLLAVTFGLSIFAGATGGTVMGQAPEPMATISNASPFVTFTPRPKPKKPAWVPHPVVPMIVAPLCGGAASRASQFDRMGRCGYMVSVGDGKHMVTVILPGGTQYRVPYATIEAPPYK